MVCRELGEYRWECRVLGDVADLGRARIGLGCERLKKI